MSRPKPTPSQDHFPQPIQVGIRMQKCVVKVLKATAEYLDMPLSGLIENLAVSALEGQCMFNPATLERIAQFRKIYGMDDYFDALEAAIAEGERAEEQE